jgi:hypothetical protein
VWSKWRLVVWLSLTALFGCGDGSVSVCLGDVVFCNQALKPVANAGPDQTVTPGAVVTLDGSNSVGSIQTYSWAQTGGPSVALTDANTARATFVAPNVAVAVTLTFRLTVVNSVNQADIASTNVAVLPPAAVALSRAIELLEGPLQPTLTAASNTRSAAGGCSLATIDLPPAQTAAQIGFWLAARSLAIAKGVDVNDPSAFLDAARMLVAARPTPTQDTAGQLESFGFSLLGALASQRDPALHEAVAERLAGASMLADPAGLLSGRTELRHRDEIVFESVPDPAVTTQRAIEQLLKSQGTCVENTNALDLTAASLRVIADAHDVDK